jgi:hypothetical protein
VLDIFVVIFIFSLAVDYCPHVFGAGVFCFIFWPLLYHQFFQSLRRQINIAFLPDPSLLSFNWQAKMGS